MTACSLAIVPVGASLHIVVSIISCFGIKSLKGKDITFKISLECLLSLRKSGIRSFDSFQ